MQTSKNRVKNYFNKKAQEFDDIYSGQKNVIGRFFDKKLRWDMEKRFERALEECGEVAGKTIIDIGCGSGRFMKALQEKKPKLILGVDFAPQMIHLAQKILNENTPDSPCKFVIGDFSQMHFKRPFDIALAIGLFDYISESLPILKKIHQVTTEKLIATFPRKRTLRARIRKLRLKLYSCPVNFFTVDQVERLIEKAGFSQISREIFGQLIFVVAKKSG